MKNLRAIQTIQRILPTNGSNPIKVMANATAFAFKNNLVSLLSKRYYG